MEKENNSHTHTVQHCHIENDEQFAGLTVNVGVKQPPSVNPYMKPRVRRTMPAVGEIVEGRRGLKPCRRSISRWLRRL